MSSRMAVSQESEDPRLGLQPTSSDSKTVSWPSTGMYCKTKPHRQSPSAAFRCLATHSLHKGSASTFLSRPIARRQRTITDDRNEEAARESSSNNGWHNRDRVGCRKALRH